MMYIGSHLNMSGPEYYLGTVKKAFEYGETAFMFYTGAPQNTKRLPTSSLKIEEARALLKEQQFNEEMIVVHAPYIINLGNIIKPEVGELAVSFLKQEIIRTADFHVRKLVLHPGSSVGAEKEIVLKTIAQRLDEVLIDDHHDVLILLETMAGKGSEVGSSFSELTELINLSHFPERLGVCLDTCHIHDAGYREDDVEGVLKEFDETIGLSKLKAIHLNDSKNPRASHKDRHENVGYGDIGFLTLHKWALKGEELGIPIILETPYFQEKAPYKKEIEMLRKGEIEDSWRDKL